MAKVKTFGAPGCRVSFQLRDFLKRSSVAAVYAASEGLKTILIERCAVGGQAGSSSRIENFLGFPDGISGAELAERTRRQALKLAVKSFSSRRAFTPNLSTENPSRNRVK
jgi:thioredoxin reductase (NADPH)